MKFKKPLLAFTAFGIFTGMGLFIAPNIYALGEEEQFIEIDCKAGDVIYKVEHDFSYEQPVQFNFICDKNVNFTFDLNGKKIEGGNVKISNSNSGLVTIKDSVGSGYIKPVGDREYNYSNPTRVMMTDTTLDISAGTISIESGHYYGRLMPGSAKVTIFSGIFEDGSIDGWMGYGDYQTGLLLHRIAGGTFKNYSIDSMTVDGGVFENVSITRSNINGGNFTSSIDIDTVDGDANAVVNISDGTFGNINSKNNSKLNISGGTFNGTISGNGVVSISGGTFSTKPDEKYLNPGYTFYEVDGKYIVDRNFMLTNFFQYMYVGQTNDAYISPAIISKTAEVTSSDEDIVSVSCKDSTKLLGQMMVESEDIISKACTITAKKAGKAVLSYTTDYGYEGSITVRVADIDATDYGNDADKAKYELTARYLSAYIADPVEYAWYTTAPSTVGPDSGAYLENLKKQFTGLISAIDDGHKIKLKLDVKEAPVTDEDKELVGKATVYKNGEGPVPVTSTNIAAAYSVSGSILDVTNNKTLVEDWAYGTSRLPIPEILKNRQRTIQIMPVRKNAEENQYVYAQDAKIEDGYIVVENIFRADSKFIVLYDGDPITENSLPDIPAVPNSAGFSDENSIAIILGASAALGLIIAVIAIYANGRKKALNKVRF